MEPATTSINSVLESTKTSVERHISRAPKDMLRYGALFLTYPEIVRCRQVCKTWRDVIDDPTHDHELFSRFTGGEKVGEERPYYEAAKVQYLTYIASKKPPEPSYQGMDYHPAPPAAAHHHQNKCCGGRNCCNTDTIVIIALAIFAACTCCCCCNCCCTGGNHGLL